MRGLIIALLALVLVASDWGRYPPQLLHNAGQADAPGALLWEAARQGSKTAQQQLVALAKQQQQDYWLEQLVRLRNPQAAWALYELNAEAADSDRLMRLAALGGVPQAQMELALSHDNANGREKWLTRAARQGHLPAQAALADWYLLKQQPEAARPWLEKTANDYPQSAFQLGRMLFENGQSEQGVAWLTRASDGGHEMASRLLGIMQQYSPQTSAQVAPVAWPPAGQCAQKIQMVATSLSSIERASQLYTEFTRDDRLASLPICLQPPIWMAEDELTCSASWQGAERLGCDITMISDAIETRQATHVIVVDDAGKANVNNGVMYLDLSDSYSVMVHELAHFAGFVDEYPLPDAVAEQYCDGRSVPNLVVAGKLTYAPLSRVQQWVELDQQLQIAPSRSCAALGQTAYKPSNQITFMEHHDSGEIPPLYLRLWQQQLAEPEQQRPVFMNLFQRFHYGGEQAKAGKWLKRYNAFNATPASD